MDRKGHLDCGKCVFMRPMVAMIAVTLKTKVSMILADDKEFDKFEFLFLLYWYKNYKTIIRMFFRAKYEVDQTPEVLRTYIPLRLGKYDCFELNSAAKLQV